MRYTRTDVDDMVFTEGSEDDIQTTAAFAQVGQRILTALRNVSTEILSKRRQFYNNGLFCRKVVRPGSFILWRVSTGEDMDELPTVSNVSGMHWAVHRKNKSTYRWPTLQGCC